MDFGMLLFVLVIIVVGAIAFIWFKSGVSAKKSAVFDSWHKFVLREAGLKGIMTDFFEFAVDYEGREVELIFDDFKKFSDLVYSLNEHQVEDWLFFEIRQKENAMVLSLINLYNKLSKTAPPEKLTPLYSSFQQILARARASQGAYILASQNLPFFLRSTLSLA